jgi:hypothetical protein
MKKIIFIVFMCMCSVVVMAQTGLANYSFYTITNDTVNIDEEDNVYAVFVSVPENATDSTIVEGFAKVLDGFTANGIKVAPNESFSFGDGMRIVRNIRIIVNDEARIGVMIPSKKRQ